VRARPLLRVGPARVCAGIHWRQNPERRASHSPGGPACAPGVVLWSARRAPRGAPGGVLRALCACADALPAGLGSRASPVPPTRPDGDLDLSADAALPPFGGRYRFLRLLGAGGNALVVEAYDTLRSAAPGEAPGHVAPARVALKIFHAHRGDAGLRVRAPWGNTAWRPTEP